MQIYQRLLHRNTITNSSTSTVYHGLFVVDSANFPQIETKNWQSLASASTAIHGAPWERLADPPWNHEDSNFHGRHRDPQPEETWK